MPGPEDYPYIDPASQPAEPFGRGTTEATAGELNPAFYFESAGGALKEEGVEAQVTQEEHAAPSEIVNAQRGEGDPFGFSEGVLPQASPEVLDKQENQADVTRPDGNDSTAKWREWAIAEQGMPEAEAKTLSRRELQERYPS